MLMQFDGHKVGRMLEKMIQNEKHIEAVHGYNQCQRILTRAARMLDLLTSTELHHFNLGHSIVLLDPDDLAFIKDHSP